MQPTNGLTRRDLLAGAASAAALTALPASAQLASEQPTTATQPASAAEQADRERRMAWWHAARFGMFIHWGLYSIIGRHEWVMENEGIPGGYHDVDDNWKSPRTVIRNLITCAHGGGNYLLNIGPKPDGSIPEESVRILTEVGRWMQRNGGTIYDTQPAQPSRSHTASFTRNGDTLFAHFYWWPHEVAAICGMRVKVKSARMFATGQPLKFEQDPYRVRITGLPHDPPDSPVTTIALECDAEPVQDNIFVRREKPRMGV
ncbi:MAG TPA: alpha-L-fucosidase [Terriglobales bacterium]|nr:alpha-L-fucosidase [Terriglobales bacterium]